MAMNVTKTELRQYNLAILITADTVLGGHILIDCKLKMSR